MLETCLVLASIYLLLSVLYVLRINWILKQHKGQIEFLTDVLSRQSTERNSTKPNQLMR